VVNISRMSYTWRYIIWSQRVWAFPWSCHGMLEAELGEEFKSGKLLMMFCCRASFGAALPVRLSLHHRADQKFVRTSTYDSGISSGLILNLEIFRVDMFTARSTPRSLYQCLRVANTQTPPTVYHSPTSLHNVPRHYSHEAHDRLIASRSFRAEKQQRGHRLFPRARRRFSSSAVAMHEHLTPPKPGEE